jgi:hypothetical protein
MPPNFYYDQQDWLEVAAARHGFTWSALRPEAVCGFAAGNPMNLMMAIAVYACRSRSRASPARGPLSTR